MKDGAIAIIGMSGRFPEASDVFGFYQNLRNGRDSVREVSKERKKSTGIETNKDYQILGYLDDVVSFDYKFFGLSYKEAKSMDPRQRILLEVAFETFENAGLTMENMKCSETAVFIASTFLDYFKLADEYDIELDMGVTASMMAGRISRYFQLKGKSVMIDTACSSSLIALETACSELLAHKARYALVGAADLTLFPYEKSLSNQVDILSPSGKCRTFSAKADGIGSGETVACLLLKRLEDAISDNDPVHAIIRSAAANQDADMQDGLTAPSPKAQTELLIKTWKTAGVLPAEIGFIETHGTGTKLGDPIEVASLTNAILQSSDRQVRIPIASVKSNIGHTDSASGIAGVIKTVLQLKHKELFPSLHFDAPNPFIDFEKSQVIVNTGLISWDLKPGQTKRIAGVSSFGLMGTNCHVILQEALESNDVGKQSGELLFAFSAKTKASLERNLEVYADYLKKEKEVNLRDVSYTVCRSRSSHEETFSFTASGYVDLLRKLDSRDGVYTTNKRSPKLFFVFSAFYTDNLSQLVKQLCLFPLFDKEFSAVSMHWKNGPDRLDYLNTFLFQYSFYKTLEATGVTSKLLLGDGVGKITIALLMGKITFEQALENARTYQPLDENRNLNERMNELVKKELTDKSLCFIEMGGNGNISIALEEGDNKHSIGQIRLQSDRSVPLLDFLHQLFLNVEKINWEKWTPLVDGRCTDFPVYQFERKRCWLKEPHQEEVFLPKEEIDTEGMLYQTVWREKGTAATKKAKSINGTFILLPDEFGLSELLMAEAEANGQFFVKVSYGTSFRKISRNQYEINAQNGEDYIEMIKSLEKETLNIDGVLDLSHFTSKNSNVYELPDEPVLRQFRLAKAIEFSLRKPGFKWMAITHHAIDISGNEETDPGKSMYDAFLSGLASDYPMLNFRLIEMDETTDLHFVKNVMWTEFADEGLVKRTGYRLGKRFKPELSLLKSELFGKSDWIYEEGTYIITGGATGIGMLVAKDIAGKLKKGRLILLGRTELPGIKLWPGLKEENTDPAVFKRVKKLKELGTAQVNVEYYSLDVSEAGKLVVFLQENMSKNERLCGIVHSAGTDGDTVHLTEKTEQSVRETLRAKVYGTINLYDACKSYNPAFMVFMSSLNALIPQKHSFDYAAANVFEDAFARAKQMDSTRFISINWPGWNKTGMSETDDEDAENCIYPKEGVAFLGAILSFKVSNVHVIKKRKREFEKNPFFGWDSPILPNQSMISLSIKVEEQSRNEKLSETESGVLLMFYELLEEEYIRIEDSFFDLGGHSLIGSKLVGYIFKEYNVTLEFEKIFDYPSVRELAGFIETLTLAKSLTSQEGKRPAEKYTSYEI
jgi:3-oxoacyl-(acyl-carrier-protein) synthase/NAD(P)-dependent dehydrogenase (short-subunit alcohol dehydrogenase family)/acyl carrier protein